MNLALLDTHAVVWLVEADPRLGRESRALADLALQSNVLTVSAFTFWEVAMLARRGRLILDSPTAAWRRKVLNLGISEIPVSGDIGVISNELDDFHPDPADRIIVATAMTREATLVTADEAILEWLDGLPKQDARL